MNDKIHRVEERLGALESRSKQEEEFPISTSVVIINLSEHVDEDIDKKVEDLISKDLGLARIHPRRSKRLVSKTTKPGLVKVEMKTVEDKVSVLRAKEQLKTSVDNKRVFIRSAQTHEERLMRSNLQTLLNDHPNGNQYRFTGSGRLVKKEQPSSPSRPPNQRTHQPARSPLPPGQSTSGSSGSSSRSSGSSGSS